MSLPQRLLAPAPGWIVETDVVVVGSGIAGLTTALRIAAGSALRVLVVTKDVLAAGSTRWAQGGIAAALGPDDSAEAHLSDTLVAGVGLCDVEAVRVLVDEGPQAVRELIELGARFDRSATGELALTREGGHHADRIAHAGGDATGAEIERALVAAVLATPSIEVIEHALVLDLLPTGDGGVGAVTLHVMGEGQRDGVGAVRARAFVIATGGIGQVYAATTNPPVSTGDGVAAALRAGAVARDLEFVQFHPTVLWLGGSAAGQQPLVSEAVRGEGAVLVDDSGTRFMRGQHELADLAPRDVVAKAILRRMRETGAAHVWLDARHFGAEKWRVRFPTILATLTSLGLDPVTQLIPVAPACHYASGGIATDLSGRTSVAGLYACGEAACTGVHGANRLASNSLLEGLVFGRRIAEDVLRTVPPGRSLAELGIDVRGSGIAAAGIRPALQRAMSADAGVIRDAAGLARAAGTLQKLSAQRSSDPRTESWEATNLLTVASALVAAAGRRAETRGSHWREDFPERDDGTWCAHLDLRLGPDGTINTDYFPHSDHCEDRAMTDSIDPAILDALRGAGLDPALVADLVDRALAEDLAGGQDVTTATTVPAGQTGRAEAVPREAGVLAGLAVAAYVFAVVGQGRVTVRLCAADGAIVRPGEVLLSAEGPVRDLLTAERTALNLLTHLSGVATLTRIWTDIIRGSGAAIRDTRKTLPGMRALQKYAVRCGGGVNHRMSLSDAALIKDNHIAAAGSVTEAFELVRAAAGDLPVEIEVDTVAQCREAIDAGAELILLDNMNLAELRSCVAMAAETGGRVKLEASGGLSLQVAAAVAGTGVDYLAVGALTHSAPVLDIGLDLTVDAGSAAGGRG